MSYNVILTVMPSFFLKLSDEIIDNPKKYIKLEEYKDLINICTIVSTILYSTLGSGYSFVLLIHGLCCALEKQIDHIIYKIGILILLFGIILNDKKQLKKILFKKEGILYMLFTFIFIVLEEKLFPEEVSKIKIISRIIIIFVGILLYLFIIRKIKDHEIRMLFTGNLFASLIYYTTSVIMKLSKGNPFNDKCSFVEEMIKRIYHLFFKKY